MSKNCYILLLFLFFACAKSDEESKIIYPDLYEIPKGFPDIDFPEDNSFTYERWLLGKRLFSDPILSRDESISCSTCHRQEYAFADNRATTKGIEDRSGKRNVPTLANVAYQPYFTSEGGVPTLEMQVLVPIQEHNEFDFNIVLIADRLKADTGYVNLALKAYGREPDHFVITRALACFERSLISGKSKYDQYLSGQLELTEEELSGMSLFFSEKTNCAGCHGGFNFTNYQFENNGLYLEYADDGRSRLTGNEDDLALFKVPTLRNIALTAPYMHDGSISTLEDVLEHYMSGGQNHRHKSDKIKELELSIQEQRALIAFLNTLTDYSFIENPLFK